MRRKIRPFIGVVAALVAYLAVSAAPGSSHPTTANGNVLPHWSCRASATYANLVGNGQVLHVEPGAANGNTVTGADADSCQSDDAIFPNPTLDLGNDSGRVVEEAPFARTRICSTEQTKACVTDFSYHEKVTSESGIEQLTLSGSGHSLQATVVRSTASGICKNGQPVLTGESKVVDLVIDGSPLGIDDGSQKAIGDPANDNLFVVLNEKTTVPDKASGGKHLIQRALHVFLGDAKFGEAKTFIELVVGESKVGYHGDAAQLCSAPKDRCPQGSSFDEQRGVCILTVTQEVQAPCPANSTRDASGACIVVVGPPSTEPGTGGNVVPLGQVLGERSTSPCKNKRFGREVAIIGTEHGDRITGSNRSDRIFVFGGNDRVSGGRGNECIEGGLGSDTLDGSNGGDWLLGGPGNDQLSGGQRADVIYGDGGNDKVIGGTGNDKLYGGAGRDKVDGGKGNDLLIGGADRDYIIGGNGADRVLAGAGNDVVNVAAAGAPAKVNCGPGVDTARINNNEVRFVRNCERVFVTTRLKRLRTQDRRVNQRR